MATGPFTGTRIVTLSATIGAMALGASPAWAVTLSSLAPGSTYRYVFTTSGTHDAQSTDIAVYNAFVTAQAQQNSALAGVGFNAIGSTATVNAIDNVSCGVGCDSAPIFTLDGNEVAGSLSALFSGSLLSTLAVDQNGATNNTYVYTGSQTDGTKSSRVLGSGNYATLGENFYTSNYYIDSGSYGSASSAFNFYGLSGGLQVAGATAVPEPASLALLGAGLAGLGLVRRRKA